MSLLQHPVRVLDQIDWYLANPALEKFSGAFELAAGNLARQLLEQVLFILAFYSGCPEKRFLRPDRTLQTAGRVLAGIMQPGSSGEDLFRAAAKRGSRIRKFARLRVRLSRWQRLLNEPSHYRKPDVKRSFSRADLEQFRDAMRSTFDDQDQYLILGAVNELCSGGRVRAVLGQEPACLPGLLGIAVVRIKDVSISGTTVGMVPRTMPIRVVPPDKDIPFRDWRALVVVQHTKVPNVQFQLLNTAGTPINLSSPAALLHSLAPNPRQRPHLLRRLRAIGCEVHFESGKLHVSPPAPRTAA